MFKLFTILFTILFLHDVHSQWTVLNPHPTGNTTYIGSAPTADRYITVSGQGEAVITHDGGATWQVIQIGGDGIYRAAYFFDADLGWAVGSFNPRLHKTTNGGLTWTHQPNAPDTTKYDVFFIDPNIGWSVGFNGFIIKTTNGGDQWFSQTNTALTTRTLYSVFATDMNTVYVAGNQDAFLKSTDGGTNWTVIPPMFATTTDFRGIYFPPSATGFLGFAVGHRSRIVKTTDGGNTWTAVYNPGGTTQLWAIDFNSTNQIGLACGAAGTVLRSTDGGDTWNPVAGLPSQTFYSVRFGADNAAYLSGANGYFFKSTDGGATWTELGYRFTSSRIRDVSFADNDNGYVVGTGFVARSTNGGSTWTLQSSPTTGDINEIVAVTPDFAVAGCANGDIIRTTNGGTDWQLVPTGITGTNSTILAIDFANENIGLVAAYNGSVARTTDGGATWNIISTITGTNPWDMHMVDSLYAWVVGVGERILRTTDGGFNWELQFAGGGLGTYGVSFIDREIGVAGGTGGNTYYTTNGGMNWNAALVPPNHTVWGIHIAESPVFGSVALTACASAYVYLSTDGGMNWAVQPRFSISTMDDVWMTDAANAWFVGNSGLILKYYEPGNIPVELNSFSASVNSNNVALSWITSSELNNLGFDVERRTVSEEVGGWSDWLKLAFVAGNGTTTETHFYTFADDNLNPGSYQYRIKQIDLGGSFKYYDLAETIEIGLPLIYNLAQNYPNPFNPSTIINWQIAEPGFVSLKVYDITGQLVATLVNKEMEAGSYSITFDAYSVAGGLASGVYFYTLRSGEFIKTNKMILLR